MPTRNLTRRLLENIVGSLGTRLLNLVATLIIVPLVYRSLGPSQYGYVSIIISGTVFFSYADLGLGLAVVNKIAGQNDNDVEGREAVTRVWFFLLSVGVSISIVTAIIWIIFHLFGIHTVGSDLINGFAVASVCVAMGLPAGLSQRVLFASHANFEAGLWSSFGRIASVIAVAMSAKFSPNLGSYVFSLLGVPTAINWISIGYIFFLRNPALRPKRSLFRIQALWPDLKTGLQFSFLQWAVYFETGVDNLLIGIFLGATFVAHFDLLARLFAYIPALVSVGVFPLWPALREANVAGRAEWAASISRIAYILTLLISSLSTITLFFLHSQAISLWTHRIYRPDFGLSFMFGIFTVLTCVVTVQSMILNARQDILSQARFQGIVTPILLISKVAALCFGNIQIFVLLASVANVVRLVFFSVKSNPRGEPAKA